MITHVRSQFLDAVEEHFPEAITSLRDQVLPPYSNMTEQVFGVTGIESIYPNPNADDWHDWTQPGHRFTAEWGQETSKRCTVLPKPSAST